MEKIKFKPITDKTCPTCGSVLAFDYTILAERVGKLVNDKDVYSCINCGEVVEEEVLS